MKHRKFFNYLLLFLVISSCILDVKSRLSSEKNSGAKLAATEKIAKAVGACFGAISKNLKPAFCWKPLKHINVSWGTVCRKGWTRRFFVCVKDCFEGFTYLLFAYSGLL